jgi:hypothetical protein
VTFAPATPTGTSFTVAETSVEKVVSVSMGSASDNVYLAAVISGSNANGEIITLHFPKVKLTSGFELSFTETDYKPLPVQFDAYPMVSTDTLYADALYNGSNPRDPGFLFRTGYAA